MERLTLDDAADRLGVSVHTVRRRVRAGKLHAEQEPTPSGFRWIVCLEDGSPPEQVATHANETMDTQPLTQVLTQVESERDHLRSLVRDQQETINRLTILLKQAQDQLPPRALPQQVLDRADTQVGMQAREQADRRPWWRRWLGSLTRP